LLLTTHVASAGNTYIAASVTVAVTVVFVSLNVNVNVVSLFGTATVAPSFFVPVVTEVPNAASSTTVGVFLDAVEADTAIELTLSDERSTFGFVLENVKLVSVSRSATSEYPSSIGATVTASGTAYTANADADGAGRVFSSSVWPAGEPTVTPNLSAPVCVPIASSLTTIVLSLTVYDAVYVAVEGAVPTYAFTAPVAAMTVLASMPLRLRTMVPVAPCSVPYERPAASPVTWVSFVVTVAASAVGHENTVPESTSVLVYSRAKPDHATLSVAVVVCWVPGVYWNAHVVGVVGDDDDAATVPLVEGLIETDHVVPGTTSGESRRAVTLVAYPAVRSVAYSYSTDPGKAYACIAHFTRLRVRVITSTTVVSPAVVGATLTVNAPIAVNVPFCAVPPATEATALDTDSFVANVESSVAMVDWTVSGTDVVSPTTHA
jgi:hypothetical protein